MTGSRISGKVIPALLITMLTFVLNGCTATRRMLDKWEDRRESLSRGLADFVDATDRVFGEPRVRDAEEIVQVRVDLNPSYYSEREFAIKAPIRVRIPLPALKRKAKFFFQFDSSTDPRKPISEAPSQLDENKSITSGFLFSPDEHIRTGTKIDVYWKDDRPQVGLRPFVRLELKQDPYRYFVQQQFFWRSDDRFGAKTSFQVDRLFCKHSYLRFICSGEYQELKEDLDFSFAVIYRRPIYDILAFSAEVGTSFNPHYGPTRRDDVIGTRNIGDLDDDKIYARLQIIGKFRRSWMEYAIEPGADYFFHHNKQWDYGIMVSLRMILFEAFLRENMQVDRNHPVY